MHGQEGLVWGLLSLPTLGTQSSFSLVTMKLRSVWKRKTQGNEHRVSAGFCFVAGDRTERGPVVSLPQASVQLSWALCLWRTVYRGKASETQGINRPCKPSHFFMLLVFTFVGKGNIKSDFLTLGFSFHFVMKRVEIEFYAISKKCSHIILV